MNLTESLRKIENTLFETKNESYDLVGDYLNEDVDKDKLMEMITNNDVDGIINLMEGGDWDMEGIEPEFSVESSYDVDDDYSWDDVDEYETDSTDWELIKTKSVKDSDDFWTEYSMWRNSDGTYGFVFGDSDVYDPENSELDWECDSKAEAEEWFDNYVGFEDDLIECNMPIRESDDSFWDIFDQMQAIEDKYWPDEDFIERKINFMYSEHKGDPDWDRAYEMWSGNSILPVGPNNDLFSSDNPTDYGRLNTYLDRYDATYEEKDGKYIIHPMGYDDIEADSFEELMEIVQADLHELGMDESLNEDLVDDYPQFKDDVEYAVDNYGDSEETFDTIWNYGNVPSEVKKQAMKKYGISNYYESLNEATDFKNFIYKNLLDAVDNAEPKLITNYMVKCSKSAIPNALYYVNKGEDVVLRLGNMKDPAKGVVSHVWVEHNGDIAQTFGSNVDQKFIDACATKDKLHPYISIALVPGDVESSKEKIKNKLSKITNSGTTPAQAQSAWKNIFSKYRNNTNESLNEKDDMPNNEGWSDTPSATRMLKTSDGSVIELSIWKHANGTYGITKGEGYDNFTPQNSEFIWTGNSLEDAEDWVDNYASSNGVRIRPRHDNVNESIENRVGQKYKNQFLTESDDLLVDDSLQNHLIDAIIDAAKPFVKKTALEQYRQLISTQIDEMSFDASTGKGRFVCNLPSLNTRNSNLLWYDAIANQIQKCLIKNELQIDGYSGPTKYSNRLIVEFCPLDEDIDDLIKKLQDDTYKNKYSGGVAAALSRSKTLIKLLCSKFGTDFNEKPICDEVNMFIKKIFPEVEIIDDFVLLLAHKTGLDEDVISTSGHSVIKYNNILYDFTNQQYKDFKGSWSYPKAFLNKVPVVFEYTGYQTMYESQDTRGKVYEIIETH